MKLAVIGGGGFRVPLVYRALLTRAAELPVDEVALYDVDDRRLAVIVRVLDQLAAGADRPPKLTATQVMESALAGADFVFCAIRVGGLEGRVADEGVARRLGVLGQETTGPGGVAYGLRTVPDAIRIAHQVVRTAPDAWVINFTNPAGMVTEAMSAVLGDRVIGICDSPVALCRRVARALGADPDHAWFDYVGLNHLGWLRAVVLGGRDELPRLLADDALVKSFEEGRLFGGEWLRALGCVPNEYLWYWYFHRAAVDALGRDGLTRGEYLLEQQRQFYVTVERDPAGALAEWQRVRRERDASYLAESREHGAAPRDEDDIEDGGYEWVALAVMGAIVRDEQSTQIVNVPNQGAVPGLDGQAVVEVPCVVDGNGAHPVAVGAVDEHQLGLMLSVKAVERDAIAAARDRSRRRALRALALHPMVDSVTVASQLLDGYERAVPELAALFR